MNLKLIKKKPTTFTESDLEKNYIEWVVAIAVMFATSFVVMESYVKLFFPNFIFAIGIARNISLLLLAIFQLKHYGFQIRWDFFVFFLAYSLYILLYITLFALYPLEDLVKGPTSLFNFFYRTAHVLIYIICAQTIIQHLNVTKYLLTSIVCATLPALAFIQFIGIETLQIFGVDDNEEVISSLSMGYSNGQLLVLGVFFFTRLFNNKIASIVLSSLLIAAGIYIIFAVGERGPVLWTLVNIGICFSLIIRNLTKYILATSIILSLLWINVDSIIGGISRFSPRTAERIEMTVKEGDTNGRFDTSDAQGSTYIIGWKMFESSPFFGSYFRLVANGHYRGHYPHNLFVEMLMTMGLFGFIPFMYLLWSGWKRVRKTMKGNYTYSQLTCVVLFFAAFLQLMTTTTLVFNSAFWGFFAVMCSLDMNFSTKRRRTRV